MDNFTLIVKLSNMEKETAFNNVAFKIFQKLNRQRNVGLFFSFPTEDSI